MQDCNVYAKPFALAFMAASLTFAVATTAQAEEKYDFGTPASEEQIKAWDINVFADGTNLPEGSDTVQAGREVFQAQCVACHGAKGEGGIGDRLVGGIGSLGESKPIKTVGSYWPYAPTVFDYVRRTMPQATPLSLNDEEVYSVVGYILFLNELVEEDDTIDAKALAELKMPNRDGFVADPRPDVK